MKAIIYEGENKISVKEIETPKIKKGQTLIKIAYAGICGSDLSIYGGTHPRAKAPLVMGHEFSGTIVGGHDKLKEGTKVTVNPLIFCGECEPCTTGNSHVCKTLKLIGIDCDGGMGEFVLVPNESVIPLPENIDLKLGAFIEPVAVAVHTARETGFVPGDNAVVFGCGTIGLCLAITLRSFGAQNITMIEPNESRLELAKELGFNTINSAKEDVVKCVESLTEGRGADWVFDCAGHPSVAKILLDVVKVKGKIVIVAGYKKPTELTLGTGMFKELSISFVRVYRNKDFKIAAKLIQTEKDFQKIITHLLDVEEAQKGFDLLTTSSNAIKVMFKF